MKNGVSQQLLNAIWAALQEPTPQPQPWRCREWFFRFLEKGWIHRYDIEDFLPLVSKKKTLTDNDISIFWANQTRSKSHISLTSIDELGHLSGFKNGKLSNGYKFETLVREDGSLVSLSVKGPRYRERKEPIETVCPQCGSTWYRGDPDSSAAHRRQHKTRMAYLDPRPDPKMLEARVVETEPELVTSESPEWKHAEMYGRATAFRREEHYDFVQWSSRKKDDDPKVHGFLMTNEAGAIVGAIAFRWREWEGRLASWGLQWVWVAPPYRRTGVLSSRWRSFRERFGDFVIEGPVSNSMKAFLVKHDVE